MLSVVGDRQTDLADELRAAEEDLSLQRAVAEAAAQKAETRKKAVEAKLSELNVDLASQQRAAADVEDRLDARLAEAEALASHDQQVSAQIKARQAQ